MTDLPALDVGCLEFLEMAARQKDPTWILWDGPLGQPSIDVLKALGVVRQGPFVVSVTKLGLRLFPAVRDYAATRQAWRPEIKEAYAAHLDGLLAAVRDGREAAAPARARSAGLRNEAFEHRRRSIAAEGQATRSDREADEVERKLFDAAVARRPDFEMQEGRERDRAFA